MGRTAKTGSVIKIGGGWLACALALCCAPTKSAEAQLPTPAAAVPAFPGAEGFGCTTPGGRGGQVIEVTNLNPSGPGSFRAAVEATGPRIIIFRVAGLIDLDGKLHIRNPFITIAGQTAPGDGICLANGTLSILTHDVVLRHLRVRVGDGPRGGDPENRDCLSISGKADQSYNIVVDHCSVSWGIDENIQTWGGPRDVTFQWCISSESLTDSLHPKGRHGKAMILGDKENTVSVHHCLFAHNSDRNPRVMGGSRASGAPSVIDFRNNVIFNKDNWPHASLLGAIWLNYVGNTVISDLPAPGSVNVSSVPFSATLNSDQTANTANQRFFLADSIWPGHPEDRKAPWPEPTPVPPVTTKPRAYAQDAVLRFAGATLPMRDVVDARVVEEVRTNTGALVNTQTEVGGWPVYQAGTPAADADHDGMPDGWEKQYGLNPADPADGPADTDGDVYTNVEEYLNGSDPIVKTTAAPPPQADPTIQPGNEALRFGKARVQPAEPSFDPALRQPFVEAVQQSGREVADYLGIRFAQIPAGRFVHNEKWRNDASVPVVLTKGYELGTCEITQEQWTRVMGTKPWLNQEYAKDSPDHPATYVSYNDAQEFLARLNACGQRQYRLPTEAEWELAWRSGGGDTPSKPEQMNEIAWHRENTVNAGEPYAHPVGQKRPDKHGLYDMVGNVHEWCQDYFDYSHWRDASEKVDPTGGTEENNRGARVLRGGNFYFSPKQLLTYHGSQHRPEYRGFGVGFRIVRLAP